MYGDAGRVALLALEAQGWMEENTIDLPREGRLDRDIPQTARIASSDGTVLAEIDDVRYGRRTFVPLSEMARDLVTATMATEDRRYYTHPGVDPVGLVRALGTNAEAGGVSQGGSTIEMQLTRNLCLTDEHTERTLGRKVKEALAAVGLDKRYSKDELLEAYLNGAASRRWIRAWSTSSCTSWEIRAPARSRSARTARSTSVGHTW